MSEIRVRAIQGIEVGDTFTVQRTFSQDDVLTFGDITRDYNPVHFDDRFAAQKKFNGRICHGLLVGSILTEIGGQIGWLASRMDFRFKRPVYFGDTITCSFTILEIEENGKAKAAAVYYNQAGNTVLEADLYGLLPGSTEQQILNTMRTEGRQ
jgi:acyl dehydratase